MKATLSGTLECKIVPSKIFKCFYCNEDHACVVKLQDELICLNCRYKDIGKAALHEALYNE